MRLEKWFISNLDDLQRQIIVRDPNENMIVQGSAGSGKTNLAIHRAVQASAFSSSYAIVVYTIALKRMVSYGMEAMELDRERIVYDWGRDHRGFDLIGDVYCRGAIESYDNLPVYYTMQNDKVYKYIASLRGKYEVSSNGTIQSSRYAKVETQILPEDINNMTLYSPCERIAIKALGERNEECDIYRKVDVLNNKVFIVQNGRIREFLKINAHSYETAQKEYPNDLIVGIDFGDWVAEVFYRNFGRRTSWFREIILEDGIRISDVEMIFMPSAILFKKAEEKIDYLIVDEAQDFDVSDYTNKFLPKVNKSISLFGDSAQKIYSDRGASMDTISSALRYKRFFLKNNYRLPKSIAKVAQDILYPPVDLISDNMKDGGNSDYPQYPRPTIQKSKSKEGELDKIMNKIKLEDLDDVAILVPSEKDVMFIHDYFASHGIQTQVLYRTGNMPPYRTINTLDFTNNDLPCILTYHAAKGTEFDNVFIPFANDNELPDRNAFYVACTRASHSLTISFSSKRMTRFLKNVKYAYIVDNNIPNDAWPITDGNK